MIFWLTIRPESVIIFERSGNINFPPLNRILPGVAQFGSALEWGSRGRRFDSCHSDHRLDRINVMFMRFLLFSEEGEIPFHTLYAMEPIILIVII